MDRYYTPEPVACRLLERSSFEQSDTVLDPSCGAGALLSAAEAVLGAKVCAGIDLDKSAIRSLRRSKPHWSLSVADLLCAKSMRMSAACRSKLTPDVLVLNPPFSQAGRRFVEFCNLDGEVIRTGQAMRFILRALELFKPRKGAFAIVPESLIYSDLDARARDLVSAQFRVRELDALEPTTFSGARVRSVAIELRRESGATIEQNYGDAAISTSVVFERGSLPVHLSVHARHGILFVHTTDLVALATGQFAGATVRYGRAHRTGWVVFLPRVGVPQRTAVRAIRLTKPVCLSDCVIALWCETRNSADMVEKTLIGNWDGLVGLYRGTGARYVTVARLRGWLLSKAISS